MSVARAQGERDQGGRAYLTGHRLALAADRLVDSDATVTQVARECGYGSPFTFSTAFKRRYGVSPDHYRTRAGRESPSVHAAPAGCVARRRRSAAEPVRHAGRVRMPRLGRYQLGAPVYDVVSGERPVYRPGRRLGVQRLALRPGDRVLDIGCGTGLTLPLLAAAVGPDGALTGIDASERMLAMARRRDLGNAGDLAAELRRGDAARLEDAVGDRGPFDAVIACYALSIVEGWQACIDAALRLLRPGGRLVIVDMTYPRGRWRVFAPLAALAFAVGGVHPHREPWRHALPKLHDTGQETLRGGHVHVAWGSKP